MITRSTKLQFIAILQPLTEHLMKHQETERRILNIISDACYELDQHGTIVFVNKRAEFVFARSREMMLDRNVWEVFPEARKTLCYEAIQVNALQNRKSARFEYQSSVTNTWISLEAIPIDNGCVVLFHEIEELKRARDKYQDLVENTPDVITRWNKDLKLIFANRALEQKTGIAKERLYGKDKSGMGFPDEVALPWMESFRKVFATGAEVMHYSVVMLPEGEVHFQSRIIPEKNRFGDVETILSIARDISSQKEIERELKKQTEELKESKVLLEQITHTMPEIICVLEIPSRKLCYFNREPSGITDFTLDELLRMSSEERLSYLVHEDDREAHQRYYEKLETLSDDEITSVEYRFRKRNGGTFWFHVKGKVFRRDANGNPTHTLHIGSDITDRKKADEQLMEQLHFISQVTTTLPDMLSVIKLENREVTYANKEPFELNGFNAEKLKRMSMEERKNLIHPADQQAMTKYFDSYLTCGETESRDLEYRAWNNQGVWEWYRVRGKVFKRDKNGVATHCVNIVQNINAWKKAEEEVITLKLQQQKKILNAIIAAEEQERERIGEALHNGVAQLLYGMQTRLQMIQSDNPEQLKELLDIAKEAINETKKIAFELVPAVLKDHGIEVALQSLLQRVGVSRPAIEFNIHGINKRFSETMEVPLYRIAQELLNNCIKHAKATKVSVTFTEKNKKLRLEVKDNGIGFDPKKIKPMDKGIGLQNIKNRVRLLQGSLKISSNSKGTSVVATLPLIDADL